MARESRWCHGAPVEPTQGKFKYFQINAIFFHFQTITTLQGEDIVFLATDVTLPGAVDWVMMQSCFGSHFMLVLEKQEKFDGHVQFFAGNIIFMFG